MRLSAPGLNARVQRVPGVLAAAVLVLLVAACSSTQKVPFTHLKYMNGHALPGTYYEVRTGDTLLAIAEKFDCNIHVLAQLNSLQPDRALGASQKVFIPRMRSDFPASYYAKARKSEPPVAAVAQVTPSPVPDKPTVQLTAATAPAGTATPSRPAVSSASRLAQPAPGKTSHPIVIADESKLVAAPKTAPKAAPIKPVGSPAPTHTAMIVREKPPTEMAQKSGNLLAMPLTQRAQTFSQSRPAQSPASSEQGGPTASTFVMKPQTAQSRREGAPAFQWPCEGNQTTGYHPTGSRRARQHKGIDLATPSGTPVRASFEGSVIYAGNDWIPSYGNMILVQHKGDWVTLYAHNQKNLVREGQKIQTGQVIAYVGSTGRSNGAHLHFEIRKGADRTVDPTVYLP